MQPHQTPSDPLRPPHTIIQPSSPPPSLSSPRRIAIAVDLSDESAFAVKWAVQNYLRPGDSVFLLHVRPTSVLYGADWGSIDHSLAPATDEPSDSKKSQQKLEDDFDVFTTTKAQDLAQPLVEAQIPFKIHIVKDHDMKERLCLEVERLGLCAVIMGSRGVGASRRSSNGRLGSVSDYCVRHCVCPVVVVRYPDEAGGGGVVSVGDGDAAAAAVELQIIEEEQEVRVASDGEKAGTMDSILSTSTSPLRGKKRKNFLWSLNQQWVSGLLQFMVEYVDANMRSAQGFKDAVYKGVAHKLKEKFGIKVTGTQCKNQIRHQRAVWAHIQELKRKSGVSWDENKNIILMGHEEYMSHIQAFPKDAKFLNTPIANYVELEKVCSEGHATGEWSKSTNCKTPFGTQQVNMDDDETSGYVEIALDATQPNDWDEVKVKGELTGIMKRAMSSSSKGCAQRKKNKGSSDDRNLREYIAMIEDGVAQVVNAIQSTTRAAEERKIFAELMTELSSIEGFSEEEVDTIYDNLSKNLTMIQSFLSKPIESKARWMQKQLGK